MTNKKAVLLVLIMEMVIYLVLLVGIPAIENILCPTCNAREAFVPLLPIFYSVPGFLGIILIVVILKRKKEVKDG